MHKFSNNTCSNWGIDKHGVPQGSIMESLLFFIYMNDIPNVTINTHLSDNPPTILFADNASAIVKNPILLVLKKLLTWF